MGYVCVKRSLQWQFGREIEGSNPEAGKYCSKDGRGLNCKIIEGGIDI